MLTTSSACFNTCLLAHIDIPSPTIHSILPIIKPAFSNLLKFSRFHPFRDSNGRIGRNLINMMLSPIGRNFVMPKNLKSNYLEAMENMRQGVYGEMGQSGYLLALSDYPQKLLSLFLFRRKR